MDRTIGKSQNRNYDGERLMISLLEIAHSMNEADDDKYVSIGFGRFKLKGKEDDDDADVYAKTDSGKYVKSADQKSDDDGGKKPEEPQGGKLGGGDFDRDSSDNEESDDVEISDANSGPIDTDDIMDMLKNDSEVVDKMGDDVYWDGMDLVSSKYDDDTIASIPDDANMTLGDLKKQIMDYEEEQDESIKVIDGKKYKAIKESKKNPRILKEIYDRTFRSLK